MYVWFIVCIFFLCNCPETGFQTIACSIASSSSYVLFVCVLSASFLFFSCSCCCLLFLLFCCLALSSLVCSCLSPVGLSAASVCVDAHELNWSVWHLYFLQFCNRGFSRCLIHCIVHKKNSFWVAGWGPCHDCSNKYALTFIFPWCIPIPHVFEAYQSKYLGILLTLNSFWWISNHKYSGIRRIIDEYPFISIRVFVVSHFHIFLILVPL